MHLAIDVREAQKANCTGKGQWTRGILKELLSRDISLTLFTSGDPLPGDWMLSHRHYVWPIKKAGLRWHTSVARKLKAMQNISAFLSPTSYIIPFLLGSTVKCIPVVHDLIAFRSEPHDRKAMLIERLTLGKVVRSAHSICAISETTKRDLCARYADLLPTKVHVVHSGPTLTPIQSHADTGNPYILCIGTLCPRKNQERLIHAFVSLPKEIHSKWKLVIAGKRGWSDDGILRAAKNHPNVEMKGFVTDSEYQHLLSRASLLAFPSLYEGFGLPILDAMNAGVPVLTSNLGSMKEVASSSALLVDPTDTSSIASGLQQLMSDAQLRTIYVEKGLDRATRFSWKHTVDQILNAL